MNRVLISLTTRQLLGRRRTAAIALVLALPILIALIYRFSDEASREVPTDEFAINLVTVLIATLLLPLVALVLGTAALGAEIEDGTAVFLLTKPVDRWRIIVAKVAVSATVTALMVVPVTMATTWIILESPTADGLMFGLSLGAFVASLLYCAVFVALSAVTSRALIFGLIYVFVWEGFATNLFSALRWASVREYANAWTDAIVTITDTDIYDPHLSLAAGVVGSILVLVAAVAFGTRSLSSYEIGERS